MGDTFSGMSAWTVAWVTIGLITVSTISRSFFFLSKRERSLPPWLERGLRYAPLAALAAVVAPDVFLTQGHWAPTWRDPRSVAALAAIIWAAWRRDMLGTILVGMAVLLGLRLGLGW